MTNPITDRIIYLCNTIPDKIRQLSEADFTSKPAPGKWSKKEILGHLIDSAANNHQRFIRGQYLEDPHLFYDQDEWVRLQDYQTEKTEELINFWIIYNRHLVYVISKIPEQNLSRTCKGRDGKSHTLNFLIDDYLTHLEHHLAQIVEYV